MGTVRIAEFSNGFVIHFETADRRINAYTLASTLVSLADAAKAANAGINFGHEIEIVVEGFGGGSFRARIGAIYRATDNLFSAQSLQTIVLAIVASFIYERTLSVNHDVKVEIMTDEVVVTQGENKVIVPRNVYNATRVAEQNPRFGASIGGAITSIVKDSRISGLGFVPELSSPTPSIVIPRQLLARVEPIVEDQRDDRVIQEDCDLQIVKAILERSERKWEFRWRGVKISAPVLDQGFYTEFFAHNITIAPGDELKVRMAVRQTRDEKGIYTNVGYEVLTVFSHISKMQQTQFDKPTEP